MGDPGFAAAMRTADRALADNKRLRALIKAVEYVEQFDGAICAWCGEVAIGRRYDSDPHSRPAHRPDCPAFTPDGAVR